MYTVLMLLLIALGLWLAVNGALQRRRAQTTAGAILAVATGAVFSVGCIFLLTLDYSLKKKLARWAGIVLAATGGINWGIANWEIILRFLYAVPTEMNLGRTAADLIEGANEAFNDYISAMGEKNYTEASRALERLESSLNSLQQEISDTIQKMAAEYGLAPLRTPAGMVFAPVKDGEVIPPDELVKLLEQEQEMLQSKAADLQKEAQRLFQKMPQWQQQQMQQ